MVIHMIKKDKTYLNQDFSQAKDSKNLVKIGEEIKYKSFMRGTHARREKTSYLLIIYLNDNIKQI